MPGPDFGWINEANPLGPPADSLNNTPLSAAELEAFRAFLESYSEAQAAARVDSDPNLGSTSPSTSVAPTQSAVQTYVSNNLGSGTGATGYANVLDPTTPDGAAVVGGVNTGTNLATPLQNIINNNAGVQSIYFPSGVYSIAATLDIPSNTHLMLARGAQIKGLTGTGPNGLLQNATATGNSNITIEGGQLNGNGIASSAIKFIATGGNLCSNLRVQGIHIFGVISQVLRFAHCERWWCLYNELHGSAFDGIFCTGKNDRAFIIGNHVYDMGDDNIAIASALPARAGDDNTHYATKIVVMGNTCGYDGGETASGGGITVRGAQNVIVANNNIIRPFGTGINVAPNWQGVDGIPCRDILVANNTIKDPGYHSIGENVTGGAEGIGISLTANNTVSTDDVRNVIVQGNTILNPRRRGIVVAPKTGQTNGILDCSIVDNHIYYDSARPGWVTHDKWNGSAWVDGNPAEAGDFPYPTSTNGSAGSGAPAIHLDKRGGAGIFDINLSGNRVTHPIGNGIDLGGTATTKSLRIKCNNNTIRRGSTGGSGYVGINADYTQDLQACFNNAYRTNSSSPQVRGLTANNTSGSVTLIGNDGTWSSGNSTGPIQWSAATTFDHFHALGNAGVADVAANPQ